MLVRPNNISIRNKLILMQVFTSLLVVAIFFWVSIITDIRSYKQRKVTAIESLAQVIGTNSISTLQFQDNAAAKEVLAGLGSVEPEISAAFIMDKQGNVFAQYNKPGTDSFPVPALISHQSFLFTGPRLFLRHDIVKDRELLGRVILQVELSELRQIKESRFQTGSLLLLLALGLSFIIAIITQSYFSKRLLRLVKVMQDVQHTGDYRKRIADNGKDEISTLINVFNNLMQKVDENQKKKDVFIGIASHELKTPLTSIKGYLELLHDMEDRQPNKQFVSKALGNVQKLVKLIQDLLDVSRIQGDQLQLNRQEFNMDSLLEDTITAVQMMSFSHEIIRENHCTGTMVFADPQRIEQVLTNLLGNAIKYSPGEKKVFVSCKCNDVSLVIKIRDLGKGVPVDEQLNIFERFYRSKDTSVHISGFGLGLYICKDIMERHQGKIWMQSEKKGSSFYISLPLHQRTTQELRK